MSSELEASVAEKLGFKIVECKDDFDQPYIRMYDIGSNEYCRTSKDVAENIRKLHVSLLAAEERARTLERERDEASGRELELLQQADCLTRERDDFEEQLETAEQRNRELAEALEKVICFMNPIGRTDRTVRDNASALLTRVKGEKL